jgi:hypothetical protein
LWHSQRGKAPTEDIDEDRIFYSIDLVTIVMKALEKDNIEYMGFLRKGTLTQEDREIIVELQNTITNFRVSGIFTYFYEL